MNVRLLPPIAGRRAAVSVGVTLVILAVLAWKTGIRWELAGEQFRRLNWPMFAGILVFSAAWHVFLGADKWWRILRGLGGDVPYWEVCWVRLASDPIRLAAPLKSGELVNAAYFARQEQLGFSRAAGSVVFDKALNFFGTLVWLYVGLVAMAQPPTATALGIHWAMGAAVLVLVCLRPVRRAAVRVAQVLHPKLGRLASGVLSAFEEFSPLSKAGFLFYGALFQLRPLVVCGLLFVALGTSQLPSLQEFLALGSLVVLMSNVPSLGGIGPREATLMAVFAAYADPATLLGVGLLMSFAVQVLPALLGIPLMFRLLRSLAAGVEPAADPPAPPVAAPREASAVPVSQVK